MSKHSIAYCPSLRSYKQVGDLLNVLGLLNVAVYTNLVLKYANAGSTSTFFDSAWLSQGFCTNTNLNEPYYTSHDLCFYANIVLAIMLYTMHHTLRGSSPRMTSIDRFMKSNIYPTLGHGFVHGMIAFVVRQGEMIVNPGTATRWERIMNGEMNGQKIICIIIICQFFWFAVLKSIMPTFVRNLHILGLSSVIIVGNLMIPDVFGFAYVQAVCMSVYGMNELLKPAVEKEHFSYPVFALLYIPIAIVSWLEATGCTWFMHYGGHLMYDISIGGGLMLVYIVCWLVEQPTVGYVQALVNLADYFNFRLL
eukprot:166122_1